MKVTPRHTEMRHYGIVNDVHIHHFLNLYLYLHPLFFFEERYYEYTSEVEVSKKGCEDCIYTSELY